MDMSSENMDVPVSVEIDGDLDMDSAVIVALGCNDKGAWSDCQEALEAALARFRCEGIDVLARSSWWRSTAWPDDTDPDFVNGVVLVRTELDPHALMAALARIEEAFGRARGRPNAPRTLDLDLVAYGRRTGEAGGLILPHPRALERRFVMGPLAEIAADWTDPVGGGRAGDIVSATSVGNDAHPLG